MDLKAWEKDLREFDLLDRHSYILTGFQDGFHQGIPNHTLDDMRFFSPPNHSSALKAKKEIEENFDLEIKSGRMFGPYDPEDVWRRFGFFRTSPLGAVVNGDGSTRPINDLSFPKHDDYIYSVNSLVDKSDFDTTWDDFSTVASFIKQATDTLELGLFDWAKAYRQIPTAKSQWPFLMIRDFNDKIIIDTRVTFGGVAGCGSFGGPADAWKDIMKRKFRFLNVFRWVDDNLFIRIADNPNNASMDDVVLASKELGVKTNVGKYREFSFEQKYIGFIWNGTDKTVRLPEEKRLLRIEQIITYLSQTNQSFTATEKLVGRLSHVSAILPQMRCYLVSIYHWLAEWVHLSATRLVPETVIDDLKEWESVLKTFKPTRLIPDKTVTDVGWIGDASKSYGIGVIVGKFWTQLYTLRNWDAYNEDGVKREIAWLETVAVRIGLQMVSHLQKTEGLRLLVRSDNSVTEAAIRNKRSRNSFVNEEWKVLQKELVELSCELHQVHVTSEENDADALSRGERGNKRSINQLLLPIPLDLRSFLKHERYYS